MSTTTTVTPETILQFWFTKLTPKQWFVKEDAVDIEIKTLFNETHKAAHQGELFAWRDTAEGRLAEIIILDQFSRNIHRGTPLSFASDPAALVLAQEAVRLGVDKKVDEKQRSFMYMPYMHSESPIIHEQALILFNQPYSEAGYQFELKHKKIIDRFGRYPHRNEILNRTSTADEIEFLTQPDSSF